ncbi:hypothetical protein BDA99DRAFT_358657 [Phascolomyces articulosus]|uniref:F-box domain-containing protein n=1 Tax=Phascolomyces articulosus TaxID=60185 RepID=A0AAD5PHI3_9FUNG|nr:hypothetical protein BDA99DRAFT_358657 [Phascolomyces articulosus]
MQTSRLPPFNIPFIDQPLFEQYIHKLNDCIQERAYQQTIHDATIVIDHLIQSQLLVLLDIRARAYSLHCQPKAASDDAEIMIQNASALAAGYIRQGSVFSMYGRQQQALEIYEKGIDKIRSTRNQSADPPFDTKEIQKLEACVEEARALNDSRVDFFTWLPKECVYIIISLLSMEEKATCILVNNSWRQRIFECIDLAMWEDFLVGNRKHDMTLAKAAPYFACFTKTLTLDTWNVEACGAYMKHMADGYFKKLHLLKTTADSVFALKQNAGLLSSSFHSTGNTLRYLDLDMGRLTHDPVTLVEVLLTCHNVTDLSYRYRAASESMFKIIFGDLSKLEQHALSLCNLTLGSRYTSSIIKGNNLDIMLQQCPKLRRLVIHGCDTSILESIHAYAPKLKILALNPGCLHNTVATPTPRTMRVPDLPSQYNVDDDHDTPGLRALIVYNNEVSLGEGLPILPTLLFIYKNQTTLTSLNMDILDTKKISAEQMKMINTLRANFKLSNLELLKLHLSPKTQEIFLGAIHNVTTFKTLIITNIHDIPVLIKNMERIPCLTSLDMMKSMHSVAYKLQSDFHQLFRLLAKGPIAGFPSLQQITLQDHPSIQDQVLDALGDIKTLSSITLGALKSVSTEGIHHLIQKTGSRLTDIKFIDMNVVTDATLMALCGCNNLATIQLENLQRVTNAGVDDLFSHTTSDRLKDVIVKNCPNIDFGDDCVYTSERNSN